MTSSQHLLSLASTSTPELKVVARAIEQDETGALTQIRHGLGFFPLLIRPYLLGGLPTGGSTGVASENVTGNEFRLRAFGMRGKFFRRAQGNTPAQLVFGDVSVRVICYLARLTEQETFHTDYYLTNVSDLEHLSPVEYNEEDTAMLITAPYKMETLDGSKFRILSDEIVHVPKAVAGTAPGAGTLSLPGASQVFDYVHDVDERITAIYPTGIAQAPVIYPLDEGQGMKYSGWLPMYIWISAIDGVGVELPDYPVFDCNMYTASLDY